jgi:hypothetical protein
VTNGLQVDREGAAHVRLTGVTNGLQVDREGAAHVRLTGVANARLTGANLLRRCDVTRWVAYAGTRGRRVAKGALERESANYGGTSGEQRKERTCLELHAFSVRKLAACLA